MFNRPFLIRNMLDVSDQGLDTGDNVIGVCSLIGGKGERPPFILKLCLGIAFRGTPARPAMMDVLFPTPGESTWSYGFGQFMKSLALTDGPDCRLGGPDARRSLYSRPAV
jgi:hypothetical protein